MKPIICQLEDYFMLWVKLPKDANFKLRAVAFIPLWVPVCSETIILFCLLIQISLPSFQRLNFEKPTIFFSPFLD